MALDDRKYKRTKFYVAKDGMELISYSSDRIRRMIATGKLHGDDLLFNKYLGKWTKARNVKGLRSLVTKVEAGTILDEMELDDLEKPNQDALSTHQLSPIPFNVTTTPLPITPDAPPRSVIKRRPIIATVNQQHENDVPTTKKSLPSIPIIKLLIGASCIGVVILGIILLFRNKEAPSRITGVVKYQGQLVEDGLISFESEGDMAPATTGIIENGKYDIKADSGLDSGQMTVRIFGYRRPLGVPPRPNGDNPFGDPEATDMYIPDEHNSTSKRSVLIYSNKLNKHDFDLVQFSGKKK